ncbi:glycosyltransferase family 4 protein [Winogradskyella sp. PE311]|uniref:glycosyltransferase family 4 protein n=1 Tax=Winogradskyella sp. PE311 TaxID=3366943 RepID=UPI00397F3B56
MKNVLYIGNALSSKGKTRTTIDTLGGNLKEICSIKIASSKSNKVLRLLDMILLVLRNSSKTDYVLIDTYSTSNFYFALIISQLCRILRIPYIPILHGGNLENRLIHNPTLSALIFKNAYKLVAPSNFLVSIILSHGFKAVEFIPNSIDIEDYKFLDHKMDDLRLLWVRSFSAIYNPALAVLVLEKLCKDGYNASLTMVGPEVDGSLDEVKKLANRDNLDISFTGKLSKKEWIELSKNHNIFINTTNFDNTPVSVIEAMALGLPVVSTDVGGMPFLISHEKNGLLVPKENVEAMVNEIIRLQSDDNIRLSLIKNARHKVEKFDWNAVKPNWQKLLQ